VLRYFLDLPEAEVAPGVKTQTFDLNHESPCGANLCTGGRAGSGSGAGLNRHGPVSAQPGADSAHGADSAPGNGDAGTSYGSGSDSSGQGGHVERFSGVTR
jgi:hypothetical protein